MKITLNKFTVSKNATANFNLEVAPGIIINNIELIEAKGMEFLTHAYSYQAKKDNAAKGIKAGDYVSKTSTFFSKEAQQPIIAAVKAAKQQAQPVAPTNEVEIKF